MHQHRALEGGCRICANTEWLSRGPATRYSPRINRPFQRSSAPALILSCHVTAHLKLRPSLSPSRLCAAHHQSPLELVIAPPKLASSYTKRLPGAGRLTRTLVMADPTAVCFLPSVTSGSYWPFVCRSTHTDKAGTCRSTAKMHSRRSLGGSPGNPASGRAWFSIDKAERF